MGRSVVIKLTSTTKRPSIPHGRTTQQRRSPITTSLTSPRSTPTTMGGITATPMARRLLKPRDKIWYKEEHYSGEPIFIPRPDGTSEDDGVLLVIVLDGATQLSYLLLLDGQSFETLAEARLETFIPMSIHGSWYDEIF